MSATHAYHYFFLCSKVMNNFYFIYCQNERMPLHWAASGGHTDVVKFLLDLGVPLDNKDDVSITVQ